MKPVASKCASRQLCPGTSRPHSSERVDSLIDFLTGHELIDEYRLMVYPFLLGNGTKRLFNAVPRRTLALVETVAFPTGVMVNTYHPSAPAAE